MKKSVYAYNTDENVTKRQEKVPSLVEFSK